MTGKQKIAFSSQQDNPHLPGVKDVSPQEVREKKDQVHLIDVRRPDEFIGELGHIPGARLVVLDTLPQHLGELPQDETVVFVCRSGGRSAQAAAFALENGWEHVYNMQGGMLLWNELKFETDDSAE